MKLKVADVRALAVDEMEQKLTALKKDLLNLRIQLKTGKLEKNAEIRTVRRSIARVMTILAEEKRKETQKPKKTQEPKKTARKSK
ncbi:MAG: 50S ribosomal protein L29 [Candidatus Omnitrophica bacterium]|nr:50S ribosomal protein L29 [Candidatus Omnitrophota bacterium]